MHATAEICSTHHRHHTSVLGQLWDKVTHRLAVNDQNHSTSEQLIAQEKEFQMRKLASRNADIHRLIMRNIM